MFRKSKRDGGVPIFALCGLWAVAVSSGLGWILFEEMTPGKGSQPPQAVAPKKQGISSMVLFLNEDCSCSLATLKQLQDIITELKTQPAVTIYISGKSNESIEKSAVFKLATETKAGEIDFDLSGLMAKSYGAHTSGEVLVYGPAGKLEFSGGITSGRGCTGPNIAADSVHAILEGCTPSLHHSAVYGCAIITSAR